MNKKTNKAPRSFVMCYFQLKNKQISEKYKYFESMTNQSIRSPGNNTQEERIRKIFREFSKRYNFLNFTWVPMLKMMISMNFCLHKNFFFLS